MNIEETECEAMRLADDELYNEAYNLLLPLIGMDSEYAMLTIAWFHETGVLGEVNLELAQSLYEQATQYEDASDYAFHYLGTFYRDQDNFAKAKEALEHAARMGHMGSMNALGELLFDGQAGPPDNDAGRYWLERASNLGHFYAKRKILFIEMSESTSLFGFLFLKLKLSLLSIRAAKLLVTDKQSIKLS